MKLPTTDCRLPIAPGARSRGRFSTANWPSAIRNRAFTLIELMVVVGIIGLLAAMGLPSIFKALQKEGMRKAVSDVEDVFFTAREQAIVYNKPVAVIFYPKERRFGVEGSNATGETVINTHSGKTVVATLPNGVELYALGIFRKDFTQSEWAKIYFNPDGTCDEAILVLVGKGGTEREQITLEYATGMPEISTPDR